MSVLRYTKVFMLAAFLASLILLPVISMSHDDNLLVNGDFEEELLGGLIPGWPSPFGYTILGDDVATSQVRAYSGNRSLRVEARGNNSPGVRSQKIPAKPGKTYYADTMIWDEESVSGKLYLEFWNSNGKRTVFISDPAEKKKEWQHIWVDTIAPPDTTHVSILLYVYPRPSGVSYFDDTRLMCDD